MANEIGMHEFDKNRVDLNDKVILITGGTGSFGKQFSRTIISNWNPRKLIIYSRDELKQFEMANELRATLTAAEFSKFRFFIGDVRDSKRLTMAMMGVDYVVHAAALKHVPIAEYNPMECVKTNMFGAENVISAAISQNVEKVIALSTDKACNPINLYGASKLASDKTFVAANNLVGAGKTRFAVVRYGNVTGSRGSVIPFFREIAKRGKALPITDTRMTRFWITLQQGVNFVLSNFELMHGGEIFVPKIPSTKITDLAKVIAPELPISEVGIRPGEKIHEMMIAEDDAHATVDLGDRYAIEPVFAEFPRPSFKDTHNARSVPEMFSYSSGTNDWWLSEDEMSWMLSQAGV
ncbi:UDP-N-acetylglucosamine 4,6-dehydratase [Pseudovibrio denitrificans]|uniref:UDP-N-acetylglucosamine 4,6-dehydratase n=1 Tax=Pseudovibrio denitrificans TaxID=258256 RepID=A0A1I7CTV3_9HYPH|nr:UDP-N-acetylglucosamine 4,6-dehydratase (inverting) [Pseudovibrio denitrificans]SFU02854.1 UDP-N-acetylglucosamine 4,6-dehydratase [Pseudovibrio denitrificans]